MASLATPSQKKLKNLNHLKKQTIYLLNSTFHTEMKFQCSCIEFWIQNNLSLTGISSYQSNFQSSQLLISLDAFNSLSYFRLILVFYLQIWSDLKKSKWKLILLNVFLSFDNKRALPFQFHKYLKYGEQKTYLKVLITFFVKSIISSRTGVDRKDIIIFSWTECWGWALLPLFLNPSTSHSTKETAAKENIYIEYFFLMFYLLILECFSSQ